jgi:hypothetical protein
MRVFETGQGTNTYFREEAPAPVVRQSRDGGIVDPTGC